MYCTVLSRYKSGLFRQFGRRPGAKVWSVLGRFAETYGCHRAACAESALHVLSQFIHVVNSPFPVRKVAQFDDLGAGLVQIAESCWGDSQEPAAGSGPPVRLPSVDSKPEIRNPRPETRNPEPETRNPEPEARNPKPETRNPKPETRNPRPETRNPKPETRDPKSETRDPKSETRDLKSETRNRR